MARSRFKVFCGKDTKENGRTGLSAENFYDGRFAVLVFCINFAAYPVRLSQRRKLRIVNNQKRRSDAFLSPF